MRNAFYLYIRKKRKYGATTASLYKRLESKEVQHKAAHKKNKNGATRIWTGVIWFFSARAETLASPNQKGWSKLPHSPMELIKKISRSIYKVFHLLFFNRLISAFCCFFSSFECFLDGAAREDFAFLFFHQSRIRSVRDLPNCPIIPATKTMTTHLIIVNAIWLLISIFAKRARRDANQIFRKNLIKTARHKVVSANLLCRPWFVVY